MPWAIRLRGNKTTECVLFLREASWYCCRQDRIRTCITLTSWCELFYYVRWGNCPLTNIDNPSPLISASTIPPPDPDSNRWKHHLSVQQNPDPRVVIVSSQDRIRTCNSTSLLRVYKGCTYLGSTHTSPLRLPFRHLTIWWGCGFKCTISTHHLFCPIGLNIREKPNFSNVCYCTYLTSSNCCSQDRSWTCVHQIQLFDYVTTTPPDYTFFCLLLDYKRKTSSNLNLLTNPSSCTEQENGEVLFLLLCSQDRIRTCTITRPLY